MADVINYEEIPGYSVGNLSTAAVGDRHIYIVSDSTFIKYDLDIHAVAQVYVDIGAGSLPYHYVIKHCETPDPYYTAGTIFQTKNTACQNGMSDPDNGMSDRRIEANDIVICTTLPTGSWITQGLNEPVEESLMSLLYGLMCDLGVTPDYIHNWYNYGDGDYALSTDSFKEFINKLRARISVAPEHVGVYDSEDGNFLVLNSMKDFPDGATLKEAAILCLGQSYTTKELDDMMKALQAMNPTVWESVNSTKKSKMFINIPSGNTASQIIANLKAKNIYDDIDENVTNVTVDTIWAEEVHNQIISEWKDPTDVHRTGDMQTLRTTRGGKSEQLWRYTFLRLPGYHNALLQFDRQDGTGDSVRVNFLVSPSDVSESRSNNVSNVKTLGGWVGQRLGKNPIQVRFTGYMLDIKENMERHNFLNGVYKRYLEDQKNNSYAYYNEYRCKLIIEGRDYYGYVTGLSFSKDAKQPFLYSYNISFVAYNDKYIYMPSEALANNVDLIQEKTDAESNAANGLGNDTNDTYKMLQELREAGLISADAANAFWAQLSSLGTDNPNYYEALESAKSALQYYLDSQDWSKEYLQWFLTNPKSGETYISSVDAWVYPDSYPKRCDTVALFDKLTGGTTSSGIADASKRWDQPLIVSLLAKKVLRDKSDWLDSNNAPAYPESECMSRALLCAMCDYIRGKTDSCLADKMSDSAIVENLKSMAATPSLVTWHWSYKHIYSLALEGCMSTPIDDYWFEDPEATVSCEYELTLIYNAYHKVSTQQPVENFLPSNSNEAILKCHAIKYIDTISGGIWSDPKAKSEVRWDAPYVYSLAGKKIVRSIEEWIDYDTSVPKYALTDKLSKAEAAALCDFVAGEADYTWRDDKSDAEIHKYFVSLGYNYSWHWSHANVYSLINKGAISKSSVDYWLDNPEYPCASGKFVEIISART